MRRRNDDRGVKLWPPFFEGTGHRSVARSSRIARLRPMWGGGLTAPRRDEHRAPGASSDLADRTFVLTPAPGFVTPPSRSFRT